MPDADLITIPVNCKPVAIRSSLTIARQMLMPEQISQVLELEPTESYRAGDLCPPSRVPKIQGLWQLSSQHLESEADINQHLRWLLTQFTAKIDVLDKLRDEGCKIYIKCRFGTAHWNTAFMVDLETLSLLSSLKMPITFDIYDEDDETES